MLEQFATESAGKARVMKANVTDAPDAFAALGVMAMPTIVFFKEGAQVDRVVGMAKLETFREKLAKIA